MPPGTNPIVPPLGELSNIVISVKEVESILKNLHPSKSPGRDGLTSRLLKEVASKISSPITKIFNKSLNSGIFPTKWKDSNLTPIFKSGQKDVIANYGGIALLPILSEVLERCVHSRILNLIEPYLSPSQHGFRRYRSCVTQLLHYVHNLATSLDAGEQIDNIYLDMEKAFDRVPHEKLLYKLEYLGIRNPLLHWIGDYLTDRRHRPSIDGISSDCKYVSSGVPQGSIIGPILFLLYINDIGSELSPETLLPLYADDAKCSRVIQGHLDRGILQQHLSTLHQWSETWGMKFNTKKCKHLCITNKRNRLETSYSLGTERIPLSTEENDLGVLISHNLSWHNHIMAKVNIANKVLRLIKRTCGTRTQPHVLLKLYIHLVRPHIEFACQVWSPHQQFLIDTIERVQRKATKLINKGQALRRETS